MMKKRRKSGSGEERKSGKNRKNGPARADNFTFFAVEKSKIL